MRRVYTDVLTWLAWQMTMTKTPKGLISPIDTIDQPGREHPPWALDSTSPIQPYQSFSQPPSVSGTQTTFQASVPALGTYYPFSWASRSHLGRVLQWTEHNDMHIWSMNREAKHMSHTAATTRQHTELYNIYSKREMYASGEERSRVRGWCGLEVLYNRDRRGEKPPITNSRWVS